MDDEGLERQFQGVLFCPFFNQKADAIDVKDKSRIMLEWGKLEFFHKWSRFLYSHGISPMLRNPDEFDRLVR